MIETGIVTLVCISLLSNFYFLFLLLSDFAHHLHQIILAKGVLHQSKTIKIMWLKYHLRHPLHHLMHFIIQLAFNVLIAKKI